MPWYVIGWHSDVGDVGDIHGVREEEECSEHWRDWVQSLMWGLWEFIADNEPAILLFDG